MVKIATIGIDLVEMALSVHGMDDNGKVVLSKAMSRMKLMEFMVNLGPTLVGMREPAMGDTTRRGG